MNITKWPNNVGRPGGIIERPPISGYTAFPSGSATPISVGAPFGSVTFGDAGRASVPITRSVPSVILTWQSNGRGPVASTTGWVGSDSRVDYWEFESGGPVAFGVRPGDSGYGCELSLGSALAAFQSASGKVFIRKDCVIGTPLTNWMVGGPNNAELATTLAAATGLTGVTKHAVILFGGETDATAATDPTTWYNNMVTHMAWIRGQLDHPVRFYLPLLNNNWIIPGGVDALSGVALRAKQVLLAQNDSDTVAIDLDFLVAPGTFGANQHYGVSGLVNGQLKTICQQLLIGQLLAPSIAAYFGW